jgi:ABC-type multidrug transport system fused ATPase/permease subunit
MQPQQKTNLWCDIFTLWKYLGKRRRTQFGLLLALMLVAVFAEVISIGAVIPFITALTAPETLLESTTLAPVWQYLNINQPEQLLLPLTLGFITAAVFAAVIRILLLWANARMTVAMGTQLRSDLYTRVLYQPYEYHVSHNSSDLISLATEKVGAVVNSAIMQLLLLVSALVLSAGIILTLLWVNFIVAVATFVVLGGGYLLAGYLVKQQIRRNSRTISALQPQAVKYMQEGIGGIRDVIMDGSQPVFSHLYTNTIYRLQLAGTQNVFLSGLPKPLLELMGISMIAVFAYWLQNHTADARALPILGALALGAQRLLPSLQQIYFSWSAINGSQTQIHEVTQHLRQTMPTARHSTANPTTLPFREHIELQQIHFAYAKNTARVLDNINLKIPKGARIGFIGETGSGKSTLLDIIMGLLRPTSGQLAVDGQTIDDNNIKPWQANIAHVPQSIFLSDASLAENIAFGVPTERINHAQVRFAAGQAQIADYIETLPEGYQTPVGERGIRLSGGQRQRIGIARALYKQAEVIVFDEATSALDTETERAVIQAIENLSDDLTIMIIAHRLTTLKNCTQVVELGDGRIQRMGSYQDIVHGAEQMMDDVGAMG